MIKSSPESIDTWNLDLHKCSRENTVRSFFHSRGGNAVTLIEKRIDAINTVIALTSDEAIIETHQLMTLTLVQQLRTAVLSIRVFDAKINTLFSKVPDAPTFNSPPGTGPCHSPRLFVAFGEVRERLNSAEEIQKYAGIAPVTERSGQKIGFIGVGNVPLF